MSDNMCEKCKYRDVSIFRHPCMKCKHSFAQGTCQYDTSESFFVAAEEDAREPAGEKERGGYRIQIDDHAQVFAKILGLEPEREEAETEEVDHPTHYAGKYECIDVMLDTMGPEDVKGFCLCNAFKYLLRCKKKHETPEGDVEKAVWYLQKYLELGGDA